jgi:Mn-dependent DtxR family transcriptional regulator
VERVLELLPDPFTRQDCERLMRVSAWTSRKFVRGMERRGLVRAERDGEVVVYYRSRPN